MSRRFVPTCTILAGPNGAGKSTIVAELAPAGEVVNADEYARRLNPSHPELVSATAGREVLRRLETLVRNRQSFNYETTLSSRQSLVLMNRAQQAGFRVELVFLILRSAELHVARVLTRVASGGHNIPATTILRRYDRSLANLPAAIRLADQAIIYDNTASITVALCHIDRRAVLRHELVAQDPFHSRIAALIGDGLGLSAEAVFHAPKGGS